MIQNLSIGVGMIVLMTAIHAVFMLGVLKSIKRYGRRASRTSTGRVSMAVSTILWMVGAAFFEMAAWAALFIGLGAFDAIEPSFYFSAVTYTSLGYGDVTLLEPLRVLGPIEALGGIIMSGWSTALVVAVLQRTIPVPEALAHEAARG